ncbi:hypothetical protein DEBA109399_11785 [Dermacoccus barathri]
MVVTSYFRANVSGKNALSSVTSTGLPHADPPVTALLATKYSPGGTVTISMSSPLGWLLPTVAILTSWKTALVDPRLETTTPYTFAPFVLIDGSSV